MPGLPLHGVNVVELASENTAFAGKLLAELGAKVVLVEPPGGHPTRRFGPFAGDDPDPEKSLWWWHYQAGKDGVVADLADPAGAQLFTSLAEWADVVLEGEVPGSLQTSGLDHADIATDRTVWISVTSYGRDDPRSAEPATDLTLLCAGGPVWSCGYDDHTLPPMRGGENQAFHLGGMFAVMAGLTALLECAISGAGQFIDVSLVAAANVTTETATYQWLVTNQEVSRQTGRHAHLMTTQPTQARAADGRWVNTGVPARDAFTCRTLLEWLSELGLRDAVEESFFLEIGVELGRFEDADGHPEGADIARVQRDALTAIAGALSAYDFFIGAQERGLTGGAIYSPDEALDDPHYRARGVFVPYDAPDIGPVDTVGSGLVFHEARQPLARAPRLGEDQHAIDVLLASSAGTDRRTSVR